ncbi:uromodulin-like isoform X2 [Ambystoma mexicanum]|uniref:uromodulin-like isoform X2 n=1 Tax=Ambystoma mexicanum TaxID=8296 RepID=UPI0037E9B6AA
MALLHWVLLTAACFSQGCLSTPVPAVTCDMDAIVVSFDVSEMSSQNYQSFFLHNEQAPQCVGSAQGKVSLSGAAFRRGDCGLQFTSLNGSITVSSTVHLVPSSPAPNVDIPIECTFPLKALGNVVAEGTRPKASMSVFTDPNYTLPVTAALPLGKHMYVKVQLEGANDADMVLVMGDCYATASASAEDPNKVLLLQSGTPMPGALHTAVLQNGNSNQGKFTFKMFKFHQQPSDVYLHCDLHVCVQSSETCHQARRRRRSAPDGFRDRSMTVSQGPFTYYEE